MSELSQSEINTIEQEGYEAQCRREDAADLLMWSLRTLKQSSPDRYVELAAHAATVCGIDDFDELVDQWIEASRAERSAREQLRSAREQLRS